MRVGWEGGEFLEFLKKKKKPMGNDTKHVSAYRKHKDTCYKSQPATVSCGNFCVTWHRRKRCFCRHNFYTKGLIDCDTKNLFHLCNLLRKKQSVYPLMPNGAFNICCPRDCVSRTGNEKLVTIVANRH